MKKFKLSKRSKRRLVGVKPDLIAVVNLALELSKVDFAVLEGVRSKKRQRKLFLRGASQTLHSRHLTGHAVDLGAYVNGKVDWDWKEYYKIASAMKEAALELDILIEWGGDWKTFKDGAHFQLPTEYRRN